MLSQLPRFLVAPFIFYQSTVLSSRAVDGHQIYFGGSVIGIQQISPTPPLLFTVGQKVRNLASFKTSLNFELCGVENAARYPKSETKVRRGCGHAQRQILLSDKSSVVCEICSIL